MGYSGTVEIMANYARLSRDAGARIIGGCCGTTPAYLVAIAQALEGHEPGPTPGTAATVMVYFIGFFGSVGLDSCASEV